jgi:hypothetical protein
MQRLRAQQIFVEGDMVVFGYGGFYERPKGWGLDLCYFHKRDFAWWKPRRLLLRRVRRTLAAELQSGRLMEGFVPQFIARLERHLTHEWHYDRADLMFQAAKTTVPSLARYADFPSFVKMVLSGREFATPQELELRVRDYMKTVLPDTDMLERVDGQTNLLFGFLLKAIEKDMTGLLGFRQGQWLFERLVKLAPKPPRSATDLDDFFANLFGHKKALEMLAHWHHSYFTQMHEQPDRIWQALRKLRPSPRGKGVGKARRAVLKEAARSLPRALSALLSRMDIPFFIATGPDLSFFRDFHQPGYLVYRQTGEMQQMTGIGLCVHRMYGRGAIFITYSAADKPRFCHTLMEECTHFADGAQNRMTMQGMGRYSNSKAFLQAFAADYAMHAPWQNSKALGLREWGTILTQMRYGAGRIRRLQKRIEAYGATLDFRHYAEDERMAEVFAALPVIDRAVGRQVARRALPNLFAFYDKHYPAGLRQEIRDQRKA